MNANQDPFDAFRRARQEEGFKPPTGVDRQAVAHRISDIIDNVTCSDEPGAAPGEPMPEAPSRRELQNVLARLVTAAESAEDTALRAACVDLLARFLERSRQLLDGTGGGSSAVGEEYEIDHDDLFDFMRSPDLGRLRQSKGLPMNDRP